MMEDHGRDGYENRESVWRRSVSSAKYAAGERARFHPVLVLVLIAIVWKSARDGGTSVTPAGTL